jgi:imidazolonepropionase-like amidohydrolase
MRNGSSNSLMLIHGRVFDAIGDEPIPDGAVWIEGDEVRRVGPMDKFKDVPENVRRIDVGGRFVMPGLIEAHAHLSYWNAQKLEDLDIKSPLERTTIRAVLNARIMLRSGYTAACSFGSLGNVDVELRDAINAGLDTSHADAMSRVPLEWSTGTRTMQSSGWKGWRSSLTDQRRFGRQYGRFAKHMQTL